MSTFTGFKCDKCGKVIDECDVFKDFDMGFVFGPEDEQGRISISVQNDRYTWVRHICKGCVANMLELAIDKI